MKKTTLRQAALKLALVAFVLLSPLGLRAQTTQTFDFEDNAIPSTWTNDATYPWVVTDAAANGGTYSIKSGNYNVGNSTSSISATFTFAGDGSISFAVRCSSEQTSTSYDWDYGTFYIDGVQQGDRIVNSTTFSTLNYEVEAGEHTFMWKYKKDGSVNSNDDCLYVDDVVVDLGVAAATPKPTGIAVSNILHNQADLSWTENGTATSWQICVNGDEENPITVTTNPYTLTGLTPLTAYTVKVRSVGSPNSDWSVSKSFSTTAEAVAVGDSWSDDFEGSECGWELINGTLTNNWVWGTAVNNGGTHALYVSNDGGTSNTYTGTDTKIFATKLLNFTEGKYTFSYDWRCKGESTWDFLRVALVPASQTLTAGTDYSTITQPGLPTGWIALDGGKLNLQETWQNKEVTVNVTAGNYYLVLAWRCESSAYDPAAAVDNVSITRVACPYDVTGLAVSNITTTGATLTWTAGEAEQWQVAYSANNNFEGATEEIVSAATYTMTGLTSATTYYAKVRAYCGGNDFGSWSEVINFPTECEALDLSTTDFSEDFDDCSAVSVYTPTEQVLPICWNAINTCTYSSYKFYPVVSSYSSSSYAHSGSNYLKFYSYYSDYGSYDPQPQYAILPEMDNLDGKQITLFAEGYNASSTLKVGRMTDPTDASTFALCQELTLTTSYQEFEVELTGTGNYIALMIDAATSSRTTNGVYVDDITIADPPTCIKPTDLDVTANVQAATVTWTSDGGSWQVFQSTTATAEPDGDNAETAGETSFTTDDLTLGDHYFWVRTDCGSDGYSEWAGPVSVHIGYCEPSNTYRDGQGITGVAFGSGSGTTVNNSNTSGLPTSSPYFGNYIDMIGSVQAGVESTIAITTATGSYPYTFIIWVDFNNNLAFDDDEIVYTGKCSSGAGTLNATITVPATQATGDYRMRISGADSYYNNFYNSGNPDLTQNHNSCQLTGTTYAVTHDYTLRVLEAPSCLPASDVTVGNVTATSAVVSWTNNNDDETTYTVKQGENVLTTTAVDSYTINGLTAATTYPAGTYTIVSNCDETAVANVPAFTTECEAIDLSTTDFSEDFDDYNAVSAYTPTERVLPICWKAINTCTYSSYKFYPVVSSNSSSSYAHSGSNYLKFYSAYSSYYEYDPQPQYAILPEMTGLAGKQVALYAKGYNANSTFKIGTMSNPEDATTFTMIAEQTLSTSYPAEPYEYIIPADCQNSYLAIMIDAADESRTTNGVYIDDIVIREAPTCIKPTGLAVTENSTTSDGATITWNAGGEETAWQIEYSTNDDFSNPLYQTVENTPTYTFNGLDEITTYYVHVQAVCGGNNGSSEYSTVVNFTTLQAPTNLPYANDFESENGWLLVNGNLTNAWVYGEATNNGGTHALYISNDGGTTNAYSHSYTMVYATKLFTFEEGTYKFSYDWKANGESTYDYLRVALVPSTVQLTAATSAPTVPSGYYFYNNLPTGWIALDGGGKLNLKTEWQSFASNEMEVAAGTYMMVFAWRNDNGSGDNPPAAIDNVSIQKITCTTPTGFEALQSGITATTAQLTWTETGEATAWQIELTDEENHVSTIDVEETDLVNGVYTITNLNAETEYTAKVRANCGDGYSNWSEQIIFETAENCQMADGLAAVATTSSANISWNGYGQETFNLRYRTDGENWETESNVANPYTLDNLEDATTYYVQVQPTCADAESWSDQLVFTTECDAIIITESWEEGFEDGALSSCWKQEGNGTWTVGIGDHSTSTGAHTGTFNAKITHNETGDVTKLITPVFDLTSLNNPALTFWFINRKWSNDIDGFAVFYRTASDAEWTPIEATEESHEQWTMAYYLLPNPNATYQIAFEMTDNYGYGVGIDDIKIEEYHVDKDIEANKWYAISSPVHNSDNDQTLAGVTNLTSGTYDLYGYSESEGKWVKPSTVLEQGKGYIYRHGDDAARTLNFVGAANSDVPAYSLTYACADNDLKGFNLVGNPYPYEANPDMDCYKLMPAGTWKVKASNENVGVCEAVLVYTDGTGNTVSFSAATPSKSSSDHAALAFTVSNDEFEDVAYARFDNGEGLPKIGHLAANAPMLSIPVEGRRYAIANLGSDCESFDMVFRGTGTYTLSFNGNTGYCHLIDRVAGKDIDMLRQNYTFSSNGFDADRFTVKLSPDAQENAGSNFAYWNGNVWMVEGNGTLQVFDVMGRQVMSFESVNTNIEIQNSEFPGTGVYVLRMGGKSQKIVVK